MEYDKFLIITSNGVWEYMSNDDVLNLTINKKNSQEFCEDNVKINEKKVLKIILIILVLLILMLEKDKFIF